MMGGGGGGGDPYDGVNGGEEGCSGAPVTPAWRGGQVLKRCVVFSETAILI